MTRGGRLERQRGPLFSHLRPSAALPPPGNPGPPPGHLKATSGPPPTNPEAPQAHLCHSQATPRPAPATSRLPRGQFQPPSSPLQATPGPPPGHSQAISGLRAGTSLRCHPPPPPATRPPRRPARLGQGRTVPGAGAARRPGWAAAGPGPRAAGAAHRGSPRAGGRAAPGLRAAASDGPAQPLRRRCGGRGARVTAGGRAPQTPALPALPALARGPAAPRPHLVFSSSAHPVLLRSAFAGL